MTFTQTAVSPSSEVHFRQERSEKQADAIGLQGGLFLAENSGIPKISAFLTTLGFIWPLTQTPNRVIRIAFIN